MAPPYAFEDSMRVHDVAIMQWLSTLVVNYGSIAGVARNGVPILAGFASPDRAHALLKNLLVQRGWIAGANPDEMARNADALERLPMPFMTVQRLDPVPDAELSRAPGVLRKLAFDEVTQTWIYHPWPRFYYTQYIVSLWATQRYTDDHVKTWVYGQMGRAGVAHNEVLIPVAHKDPWGEMFQRCRFDGSSDVSELEGEGPRLIRVDYNFTLRTLVMHNPTGTAYVTDRSQLSVESEQVTPAGPDTPGAFLENAPEDTRMSGNLWKVTIFPAEIPRMWEVDGNAQVSASTLYPGTDSPRDTWTGGLKVSVSAPTDVVEVFERITKLVGGGCFAAFSFKYMADGPMVVEITQRAPGAMTMDAVARKSLGDTQGKWAVCTLVGWLTEPVFAGIVIGSGTTATAQIVDIDVRAVWPGVGIPPTASAGVSPTIYEWAGLAPGRYALSARTTGTGTLIAQNDAYSPNQVFSQAVVNVFSYAQVLDVRGTSVRLSVPSAVTLADLSLAPYAGAQPSAEV